MKVRDLRNWLRGMDGDAEVVFLVPSRQEYYAIESCAMTETAIGPKAQLSPEPRDA